jgi:hypothetical protein
MMYDINTIDELVQALNGPTCAAQWAGTKWPSAISNWVSRGYVPPSRQLRLLIEMKRRGKTINPALLELTQEDLDVLAS